jgi:hypothetical protein
MEEENGGYAQRTHSGRDGRSYRRFGRSRGDDAQAARHADLRRRHMFVVAGFEALSALLAFAGTGWWATVEGDLVYANFVFYGILDLIIGLIALYAGIDILRGGTYGLLVGYLFAVVGAIRWLFAIPAAPVLSVVVIALCVMVVYGLAKHSDYFDETA